jgi:hypothetical protein
MRLLLSPRVVDRTVRRAGRTSLSGVLLMTLAIGWLHGVGFVTGLMLLMSGGSALGFRRWLRERGLWMLAALSLTVYGPLFIMIEYDNLRRHLNGPPAVVWGMTIDSVVAAGVLWQMNRFLASVIWYNRRLVQLPGGVVGIHVDDQIAGWFGP